MIKKKSKKPHGYRGSSSDGARDKKLAGHKAERDFAESIGNPDGVISGQEKPDVVDNNGDNHTVKSAKKKWQIFLYNRENFERWLHMNGVRELLLKCIDAFPDEYRTYAADKKKYKEELRDPMRKLKDKLSDPKTLKLFLSKSMFNDEECKYLTVLQAGKFHVFHKDDVLEIMCKNLTVKNAKGVAVFPGGEQKVLLVYNTNVGEVEMRNELTKSGDVKKYKLIRFNMYQPRILVLLFGHDKRCSPYNQKVILHGKAIDTFPTR